MNGCKVLIDQVNTGAWDERLGRLYGSDLARTKQRVNGVLEGFRMAFGTELEENVALFSSPGRTELGGNHTDHQHGRVLCAAVNLDMLCCAAVNERDCIRICSEGYSRVEVDLGSLLPRKEEKGTTAALVRGVAAQITKLGYKLKGFDAYIISDVLPGSGLSSSAAFEVLIGTILNHFCCGDTLSAVDIAKIGQFAENIYFGKPCGLMDQMACAIGGAVAIDFKAPQMPAVKKVEYPFERSGYALCIIDSGSCHADLTEDYAAVSREMGRVAAYFGKQVLREVREDEFRANLAVLRERCGDRAVLRALHFYNENRRVEAQIQFLEEEQFLQFLNAVQESGLSSALWLQNTWPMETPDQQPISLIMALGMERLKANGAVRVHGGGFAGTVQAFVPEEKLPEFKAEMEQLLGEGRCRVLQIREHGCCMIG